MAATGHDGDEPPDRSPRPPETQPEGSIAAQIVSRFTCTPPLNSPSTSSLFSTTIPQFSQYSIATTSVLTTIASTVSSEHNLYQAHGSNVYAQESGPIMSSAVSTAHFHSTMQFDSEKPMIRYINSFSEKALLAMDVDKFDSQALTQNNSSHPNTEMPLGKPREKAKEPNLKGTANNVKKKKSKLMPFPGTNLSSQLNLRQLQSP